MENSTDSQGFAAELIRQGVFDDQHAPAAETSADAGALPAARPSGPFVPLEPESVQATGLRAAEVEAMVLKFLLNTGVTTGRQTSDQLRLPFGIVHKILQELKAQMQVSYKASAPMSDYQYELSDAGIERARRCHERCSYFGAAPVSLDAYRESVYAQSMRNFQPKLGDVCKAFDDMLLEPATISQVGQALHAGRGLLLFGEPGNGKTSIAERLVRGAGSAVWIPRTISLNGEILRVFDPSGHEVVPEAQQVAMADGQRIDRRWVLVRRPTIIVGAELQLEDLEITRSPTTGVHESPVQLKSNCGALVIDDFGRQRISATELLNRWIAPLENGHDFLWLATGRQIQVPFDQMLVFATNLDPKTVVDPAILRRIPYKIEVRQPSESQFAELFRRLAPKYGFEHRPDVVDHLFAEHFRKKNRPLSYGYVPDLLMQAKCFCSFHERPLELSKETIDVAAHNYFARF